MYVRRIQASSPNTCTLTQTREHSRKYTHTHTSHVQAARVADVVKEQREERVGGVTRGEKRTRFARLSSPRRDSSAKFIFGALAESSDIFI